MAKTISDDLYYALCELKNELGDQLSSYRDNEDGSSYACNFCNRPQYDNFSNHDDNCLGIKLNKLLKQDLPE